MVLMSVRKVDTLNPLQRWRWSAAGTFGYAATRRGAAAAARRAMLNLKGRQS